MDSIIITGLIEAIIVGDAAVVNNAIEFDGDLLAVALTIIALTGAAADC